VGDGINMNLKVYVENTLGHERIPLFGYP